MKELVKKYALCLSFSFVLLVVVWLSEILRDITLAVASGWSSGIVVLMALSVGLLFLFLFLIVPFSVLALYLAYPRLMKAFMKTFGVTENLLEKEKTKKGQKS